MSTLTYHRKPSGTAYVYRQESYWDKAKRRSAARQVCLGKLGDDGEIIYNKRFADEQARQALESGEAIAESTVTGQSMVLDCALNQTGLNRVLRASIGAVQADALLSLAYSVIALGGVMYHAPVWIGQNDCPLHTAPPSSQEISKILAAVSQSEIEDFLAAWMNHRNKGACEQYCFDITSISSHNASNPFAEYGYNWDGEKLAQINLALLTGVASHIPTYYEILPGSMSDVKTITGFCEHMKKYDAGRLRMLIDRGFYSSANLKRLLDDHIGFLIPAPSHIKTYQDLIDEYRDTVEMPEHIISVTDDNKDAVYGMTVLAKIAGKRVWQHVYYDKARRTEHILAFFNRLAVWEQELISGVEKKDNAWAYEQYFSVKTTPRRGRQVKRKQNVINAYKTDGTADKNLDF
jgi:hypothetical protein